MRHSWVISWIKGRQNEVWYMRIHIHVGKDGVEVAKSDWGGVCWLT